jgi:imidazolonepropionase-like amidohydrolase
MLTFPLLLACLSPSPNSSDTDTDSDATSLAPTSGDLLLTADRVFLADDDLTWLEPGQVLIRDGEIVAVGQNLTVDAQTTLDLGDTTLLPGFVDAHVHMGLAVMDPEPVLTDMLSAGVTAVQDLGGPGPLLQVLAGRIADGEFNGPTIYTAGPFVTAPGGHPSEETIPEGLPQFVLDMMYKRVSTPAEAQTAVQEVHDGGFDVVKVVYDSMRDQLDIMDNDTLTAAIAKAHALDMRAAVHTGTNENVLHAVAAGADTLEHGVTQEEASSAAMDAAATTIVTSTIRIQQVHGGGDYSTAFIQGLLERDGTLVVGTDLPAEDLGWTFDKYGEELMALYDAGMPMEQVLRAATSTTATAVGRIPHSEVAGQISVGLRADLVALSGDPREAPETVLAPLQVFIAGVDVTP